MNNNQINQGDTVSLDSFTGSKVRMTVESISTDEGTAECSWVKDGQVCTGTFILSSLIKA